MYGYGRLLRELSSAPVKEGYEGVGNMRCAHKPQSVISRSVLEYYNAS